MTLLRKEMRLSALLITYLFTGFGFMTLLPGYPILCGVFFISLGIYQSEIKNTPQRIGYPGISAIRPNPVNR